MSQSFNPSGVKWFFKTCFLNRSLLVPDIFVGNIGDVDFETLRAGGYKGVVFDKDNTLTAPYVNEIHSDVKEAFDRCLEVFGKENVLLVSNSAGTGDDPGFKDAKEIEKVLGVGVLRHEKKKPDVACDVSEYFGFDSCKLVVIGDRIFTDVVFGNVLGALTVHTKPLTLKDDNKVAVVVRFFENILVK